MPTSEFRQIPYVLDVIVREKPRSVLDVGAGYGKYGFLAREYANPERVDGLDVNPPRFDVYDHFYRGDLRELERLLPPDAPRYDLALLVDVIEHLEKAEGYRILEVLTRRARRVLVTTPWGFRRQEIEDQPFETHRSGWQPWDFQGRFHLYRWKVFPGHRTRHLGMPRLWQLLAVVGERPLAGG